MKILVAIESSENPKTLARRTLRWAARAGFNMRIFIPDDSQLPEYLAAVKEANYEWYLDLPDSVIVTKITPKQFAKDEGFDLILYLPDDMRKWKTSLIHEINVLEYARQVGAARLRFSKDPNKKYERFSNGAIMERIR